MLVSAVCLGWERCPQWHGGRGWRHWVGLGCPCSQRTCRWWLLGFWSFQVAPACHWCHDVVVFSFSQRTLVQLLWTTLHFIACDSLYILNFLSLILAAIHHVQISVSLQILHFSAIHKWRLQKCVHFWCNPYPEVVDSSIVLSQFSGRHQRPAISADEMRYKWFDRPYVTAY